jgi:hypothetical protein
VIAQRPRTFRLLLAEVTWRGYQDIEQPRIVPSAISPAGSAAYDFIRCWCLCTIVPTSSALKLMSPVLTSLSPGVDRRTSLAYDRSSSASRSAWMAAALLSRSRWPSKAVWVLAMASWRRSRPVPFGARLHAASPPLEGQRGPAGCHVAYLLRTLLARLRAGPLGSTLGEPRAVMRTYARKSRTIRETGGCKKSLSPETSTIWSICSAMASAASSIAQAATLSDRRTEQH